MPDDWFDGVIGDIFAAPKPAPKKRKAAPSGRDPYGFGVADAPAAPKRRKAAPSGRDPYDFSGLADAYRGARGMAKAARGMHQRAKKTPTDHDEIMRRARAIRERQRRERERAAALRVIKENDREDAETERKRTRASALDIIRRLARR